MSLHPAQRLNCTWPLVRGGKGWARAGLIDRCQAALKNLLRTPVGFYPWSPSYGTSLYKLRTQSVCREDAGLVRSELSQTLNTWIPEITFANVELDMDQANKRLIVTVTWMLPAAVSSPMPVSTGPYKTTVRI